MRKDERKASEPKGVYRVRNWQEYNTGLIARGDVTMWIDQSILTQGSEAGPTRRGRPPVYSDAAIQMLLSLKQVFHLPLRALQGFAQSLRKLAFPNLPVPNYTTLSRRAQTLKVVLPTRHPNEPMHLVIDSTGLSVIASGGVSKIDDVQTLSEIKHPRLDGVIIGKALYEGLVDLKTCLKMGSQE